MCTKIPWILEIEKGEFSHVFVTILPIHNSGNLLLVEGAHRTGQTDVTETARKSVTGTSTSGRLKLALGARENVLGNVTYGNAS